ncbi:SNF2-related protein [Pseudolysinimonas sp.]|uniref:SNF2-related protein n=1 Tax=Pseudolysinimonas sp. TaxID=2680009 RepID=UPI003F7E8300
MKYGPFDPRYPDGFLEDGETPSGTIREDQEWKIQRVCSEPTRGALIADDMGKGKTLMATEIALRKMAAGEWRRVLIVGIRDTGKQWAESFREQSDGRVQLRLMRSDEEGEKNWKAFIEDGAPGVYFAGIQWLTSRDWSSMEVMDHNGRPKLQIDKKTKKPIPVLDKATGEQAVDDAGDPVWKIETQSVHDNVFRFLKAKKRHLDAMIFDEVHKMQNRHSNTAHTITSIKSDWRIGLSGTFMGNLFEGAWKVTRWIWPDVVDASFVRWKRQWATLVKPVDAKGREIPDTLYGDNSKITGELVEGAYVKQLPCYIRDEPEPVPPPRVVKVQLTPEQREQYRQLEKLSMTWLEARFGDREPLIADLPITQRQRLRTATLGEMRFDEEMKVSFDVECASSKLNTAEFVLRNIWKEQPVLIGVHSMAFAKVAAARLQVRGLGAQVWHGQVPKKERDALKERFIARDPSVRYLVATIPSIGTGVDGLQKACSKILWLERSENRADNLQFVKRIFRPGMTLDFGAFEHAELVAEGTIDEGIIVRQDEMNRSMTASLRVAA